MKRMDIIPTLTLFEYYKVFSVGLFFDTVRCNESGKNCKVTGFSDVRSPHILPDHLIELVTKLTVDPDCA